MVGAAGRARAALEHQAHENEAGKLQSRQGIGLAQPGPCEESVPALDHVILDEMAHFVSPRHDEVFLSVLDRNMPGWRQVRADLNALPLSD